MLFDMRDAMNMFGNVRCFGPQSASLSTAKVRFAHFRPEYTCANESGKAVSEVILTKHVSGDENCDNASPSNPSMQKREDMDLASC